MVLKQGLTGRYLGFSYAVVGVLGAVLFTFYWWSLGKIFPVKAEEKTTEEQSVKPPGSVEQKNEGSGGTNIAVTGGDHVTINVNTHASIPQPKLEENPSGMIYFSIGEQGITVGQSIGFLQKGYYAPFNFGGYAPVTLHVNGNVLLYDFKIWAGTGVAPIEVKNNRFTVRVPEWDWNSNANAFEVVDEKNVTIFQLIRKTQDHIIVNGIFPMPDGRMIVAGPKGAGLVKSVPSDFVLKPIFRYPSWKYPGQYAD